MSRMGLCTIYILVVCTVGLAQVYKQTTQRVYTVGFGSGYDYTTIQAGINACVNGDRVQVYPGTYSENIDFLGKRIKVQSTGGAGRTTIDGGQNGPVVTMDSGEVALTHLDGFTVTNGLGQIIYSSTFGGGIFICDTNPTIKNCTISYNYADVGGGIYVHSSPVAGGSEITNCLISNSYGDGVFISSNADGVLLDDCIVEYSSRYGIGSLNHAQFEVSDCDIRYNHREGISASATADSSDYPYIHDNEIYNNDGTGLYMRDSGGYYDYFHVEANEIYGNGDLTEWPSLDGGGVSFGGIREGSGNPGFINNLVYNNEADEGGGAIVECCNDITLHSNTFANNTSEGSGGGILIWGDYSYDVYNITNCILWGNAAYVYGDQIHLMNGAGTLGVTYSDIEDGYTGTGNIDEYPDFVAPGIGNYHLGSTSDCIDAGTSTGAPDKDIDGDDRDDYPDMGADEYVTG